MTELTEETEPPDNSLTVLRAELEELRRRVGVSVAEIDLLQVEAAASKRQVVSGASVLVAALALVVSVGTFVVGQVNVIADRQIQDNVPAWLACCRRSQPRGVPPVPGDLSRDSPTSLGGTALAATAHGARHTRPATAAHGGDDKVSAGSIRELPPTRQRPHTSACTAGAETWNTGVRRAPRKEEPMATLDYALLAEYARIDPAGLVTIVGGSFDRVQASSTSGAQQTYVVIRVLLDESEEAVSFEVSVGPPNKTYALQLAGTAKRNPAAVPVDGRVGVTLAIGLMVPIVAAGRYVVRVSLEGQPVQDLPFVVDITGYNGP